MSPPFAMIPDISRSGTPPIPPLAPSAYAEMLRAQRDLRDVLLARSDIDTRGSERDDDGDGDEDGVYDSIDAAFPEGNQRTSGDGERETRDGARGREDASEYDELRGVRTTSAAAATTTTATTATRSGHNMGDESTATMMMGAARDLLGGGYWSGTASGSHTPSASVGGDETTTKPTATATGSAEPSALHRVMVGKPPKGTGNYDKPSGDVVEPVKASTTGRARMDVDDDARDDDDDDVNDDGDWNNINKSSTSGSS